MELSKVLDRIRGLIAKAESLETSGDPNQAHEAVACRERADELMQKYAVEEWQTLRKAPESIKPTRIKINIGQGDNPFLEDAATLVNIVAKFCKCSSMWIIGSGWGHAETQEYCWVYGYESDLRYFELLFTTLYLHMEGAIFPKPDLNKTLGENVYELHNAGLNWTDIANMYGFYQVLPTMTEPAHMYVNKKTGDRVTKSKAIDPFKKAYQAEIARRGEEFLRIPPNGSMTFRRNAADGYLARINQRLREIAGQRGTGAELVLADKSQNIAAMIAEMHPGSKHTGGKKVTFNGTAYRKGTTHANSASLNPETTASPRPALGES